MTPRRARPLAAASSGMRVDEPSVNMSVKIGHAKLPTAKYKNRNTGSRVAKIKRAGSKAAKSIAHGAGFRDLSKVTMDGNPPRFAASAVSSGTKLASGIKAAVATDNIPTRKAAVSQNPQNPTLRASQ
jgi:hypothetical protein